MEQDFVVVAATAAPFVELILILHSHLFLIWFGKFFEVLYTGSWFFWIKKIKTHLLSISFILGYISMALFDPCAPWGKLKTFVVIASVGLVSQLFYLSVGFKLHLWLLEPLVYLVPCLLLVELIFVDKHPSTWSTHSKIKDGEPASHAIQCGTYRLLKSLSFEFKNISSYHVRMGTGADTIHQLCFYPVKRSNACTRLCGDTGAHNWQLLRI